jgi:hypothetical protein
MDNILYLPVSLGEAIDKLTILDIKYDKIKDNRRNEVKIEFDMLYEKLKDLVEKYNMYYKIMKQINLDIWIMMDILRDSNISNDDYLIKCKECIEANDVRFRIKNKINFVSNSLLKEQKGYNISRIIFNINNYIIDQKDLYNIIKYYSFLYDELIILSNKDNINILNNEFEYDPTILIYYEYNNEHYKKKIFFSEKNINEIYNELNIDEKIIENYFIYF